MQILTQKKYLTNLVFRQTVCVIFLFLIQIISAAHCLVNPILRGTLYYYNHSKYFRRRNVKCHHEFRRDERNFLHNDLCLIILNKNVENIRTLPIGRKPPFPGHRPILYALDPLGTFPYRDFQQYFPRARVSHELNMNECGIDESNRNSKYCARLENNESTEGDSGK